MGEYIRNPEGTYDFAESKRQNDKARDRTGSDLDVDGIMRGLGQDSHHGGGERPEPAPEMPKFEFQSPVAVVPEAPVGGGQTEAERQQMMADFMAGGVGETTPAEKAAIEAKKAALEASTPVAVATPPVTEAVAIAPQPLVETVASHQPEMVTMVDPIIAPTADEPSAEGLAETPQPTPKVEEPTPVVVAAPVEKQKPEPRPLSKQAAAYQRSQDWVRSELGEKTAARADFENTIQAMLEEYQRDKGHPMARDAYRRL